MAFAWVGTAYLAVSASPALPLALALRARDVRTLFAAADVATLALAPPWQPLGARALSRGRPSGAGIRAHVTVAIAPAH